MHQSDWGMNLVYRDKSLGERPASFDVEKLKELYHEAQTFGSEHSTNVELWERKLDAPKKLPPSVVFFNTFGRWIMIEVDRDQDLIDLLVYLAPLGTAIMLSIGTEVKGEL